MSPYLSIRRGITVNIHVYLPRILGALPLTVDQWIEADPQGPLDELMNSSLFWSSLSSKETLIQDEGFAGYGYQQPTVRRAAWALLQSIVDVKKGRRSIFDRVIMGLNRLLSKISPD